MPSPKLLESSSSCPSMDKEMGENQYFEMTMSADGDQKITIL